MTRFSGQPDDQVFSCCFDNLFCHRLKFVDLQDPLHLHQQLRLWP
jgi:hypothetical protein